MCVSAYERLNGSNICATYTLHYVCAEHIQAATISDSVRVSNWVKGLAPLD